jgi:hypothetical protein
VRVREAETFRVLGHRGKLTLVPGFFATFFCFTPFLNRAGASPQQMFWNYAFALLGLILAAITHNFRQRFISFSQITRFNAESRAVLVTTTHGETFAIVNDLSHGYQIPMNGAQREKVYNLAIALLETWRAREKVRADDVRVLNRQSYDTSDAWLAALNAVSMETSYRAPAISPDELAARITNTEADDLERAGAAYVLHKRDPALGLERLRIATEGSANERLRVALSAIESGKDGASEQALLTLAKAAKRK